MEEHDVFHVAVHVELSLWNQPVVEVQVPLGVLELVVEALHVRINCHPVFLRADHGVLAGQQETREILAPLTEHVPQALQQRCHLDHAHPPERQAPGDRVARQLLEGPAPGQVREATQQVDHREAEVGRIRQGVG